MMTRKDYVATAEILNNWFYNHPINEHDFGDLVGEFALMFADDNPNFNHDKFETACYVSEEDKMTHMQQSTRYNPNLGE